MKNTLFLVAVTATVWAVPMGHATGQRRAFSSHEIRVLRFEVTESPEPSFCASGATQILYPCPRLITSPATPPVHAMQPVDSTRSHTLDGLIIGALGGGATAMGMFRLVNGQCKEGGEGSLVTCDMAYAALFVVGAIPGALLGGIVGSQIKTKR